MNNRKPFIIHRASSSSGMEIEPSQSNQHGNNNRTPSGLDINPMFAELQIKRDDRRTSERMRAHNLSLSSNGARSEDSIGIADDLGRQNSDENNDRPASLQILGSPEVSSRNLPSTRNIGSNILSYLQNLANPFRRASTSTAQSQNAQPFPLYMNPLNLGPAQAGQNDVNLPQISNGQHQNAETQTGANIPDVLGNFPHGALIVRTVSPGPNDTVIVRMRVIPIDDILGAQIPHQEGQEGNGAEPSLALFGALINILSGNFMAERGMEQKALESLPLVTYDSEAFKNVDEESKRCTICFEDYEDGNELRYLWCLHRFHKNCVDQWLGNHTTCPICKKDYAEAQKDSFIDIEEEPTNGI